MRTRPSTLLLMTMLTAGGATSCSDEPTPGAPDAGEVERQRESEGPAEVVADELAPETTSSLTPRNLRVAVIPFHFRSGTASMNNPVVDPPAWGAAPGALDILQVYFTGTGLTVGTGSARNYWSQVSDGNNAVTGHVYPWTTVRNAGTVDLLRNRRPLYQWFNASLPGFTHYIKNGVCTGAGELNAANQEVFPAPRNLHADGTCLCRDVPSVTPHYLEMACGATCPDGSPDATAQPLTASTGATWCRTATEISTNLIPSIQYSIPPNVGVKDHTGASQTVTFNPANYDVIAYVYPESYAGVGGSGMLFGSVSDRAYAFYTASHELGHNLGLAHSSRRVCATGGINRNNGGVAPIGTPATLDAEASCYAWLDQGSCCSGYGPFSMMGAPGYPHYINAYQRLFAGALDPAALTTVTGSGSYLLDRATGPVGTRALRIATNRNPGPAYYYLEYRTAAPGTFDATLPSGMQGITVTMAPDHSSSDYPQLLDAHPATFNDFNDAALKLGESFTDPGRGLVSQVAATDGLRATIDISLRPASNLVFSYRAASGERWVHGQDATGVRTLKTTTPGASTSWTHVAACNGHGLLYYASTTGAAYSAYVASSGFPQSVGTVSGLPAGFTHVTCAGKGNLFLYNQSTGAYATGRLSSLGVYTAGATGALLTGWTAVAGTPAGKIVLYGRPSGSVNEYRVASLDEAGQFSPWTVGTAAAGYTIIAPVRENGLVFYKSTGPLHVARIDDGGQITFVSTTFSTYPGYTHIVGGQNGGLTLYNASQGYLDTTNVSSTFSVAALAEGYGALGMKLTGAGGY